MKWTRKHLLGLEELTREEIEGILETAESFSEVSTRNIKKVPALRGRVVVLLFFEPSTRTSMSFGMASRRLSADTVNFNAKTSSLHKGETLKDTALNIEAMGVDIVVVRHSAPGAPHILSKVMNSSIVNAGDGAHEHPTQALLDLYTIKQKFGKIEGLTVGIVGDVAHSRVARSNIWGLKHLGAKVILIGPSTLIPKDVEKMGVEVSYDLDDAIKKCDVLNILRLQLERQQRSLFPSIREYARVFGLNKERLKRARKDVLVLHPGPINRGVEITPDVADGEKSVILDQVTNGLAVRMAVLYLVSGGER